MALPTASDNVWPKLILSEAAAPAAPSAGQFKLYFDSSDHLLKWKNSAGTVVTIATGTSGLSDPMTTRGDIIVRNAANTTARLGVGAVANMALLSDATDAAWGILPGTLLAVKSNTAGDCSTSSASLADADATNMAVTFTAPASGKVLVRLVAAMSPSSGGASASALASWGLRESTTNVAGPMSVARAGVAPGSNVTRVGVAEFYLTGISAGSHTYKWAHTVDSSATTVIFASGTTPAVMTVWAA